MILDAYINEDSNEFDYFNFINEMNDISEDLIIESHEIIKECENSHNKLFTINLLENYRYLKENGIILEEKSDNKIKEFFNKIINIVKTWLSNIMNFIDKFFDKISQKINGIDKLKKMVNPKYEAGSDIESVDFNVLTNFTFWSGLTNMTNRVYLNLDNNYGFIDIMKNLKYFALDREEGIDSKEVKEGFTNIVKAYTGKEGDTLNANDIVSRVKVKEEYKITYKKDGSNVPSLSDLIVFIENYTRSKDEVKKIKNTISKVADSEIDAVMEFVNKFRKKIHDDAQKSMNKAFGSNDNEEYKNVEKSDYMPFLSSIITKLNTFNAAICAANLIMMKDARVLAIKLAKNYKPGPNKSKKED